MKKSTWIVLFAGLICTNILSSCSTSKAKSCVEEFFKAVKNEDESQMKNLYPSITDLASYMKSDEFSIKKTESLEDEKYKVIVTNKFTNGFGKTFERDIEMFVRKSSDEFIIYDSKGLCDYENNSSYKDIYKFCKNTGCIKDTNITDVEMSKKITEGMKFALQLHKKLLSSLEEEVKIKSWEWEVSEYSGSASGKGIVYNGSSMNTSKLKYEVTYKDRGGNVITTDDGYVSYSGIESGKSESFTFYTSYVGQRADKASLKLVFDEDALLEGILNTPWSGDEYDNKYKYIY